MKFDTAPAHKEPETAVSLHRRSVAAVVVMQLLAPIMVCFLVIHVLVGIQNLERHYWFADGVVYSATLNSVAFLPFLHRSIRRNALTYSLIAAISISLVTLATYGFYMIALMA